MVSQSPAAIKLARNDAMLDFEEGRLPEAESRLDSIIQGIGVPQAPILKGELCRCLIDRATVRRYANRWQDALDDLAQCETTALALSPLSRNTLLFSVQNIRAKLLSTPYSTVYNPALAIQALEELRRLGGVDFAADAIEMELAFHEKQWVRAAQLAGALAQELAKQGWQRGAMSCRLLAGRACLEQPDLPRAQAEISAALDFFTRHGPPDQLAAAQMAWARLQAALGQYDLAWEFSTTALNGVENLIRCFRSLFDQQVFLLDKMQYYRHAFLIGYGKGGREGLLRAWRIAERAKSFYLCQIVANADVPLFDGVDPDQIARLRALEQQLDAVEAGRQALSSAGGDPQQEQAWAQRLQDLSAQHHALFETIMRQNPRWAALRTPPPFDLETALHQLDKNWVPLSYFSVEQAQGADLYIFYAGSDREPRCVMIPWTSAEIDQVDQARAQMRLPKIQRLRLPVFPPDLAEKVLPASLQAFLEPGMRLLVSPHAQLRGVPLHAIGLSSGDRLIQRCPVQYIPTLALLARSEPARANGRPKILLLGCEQDGFGDPPLTEVRGELEAIHQLWRDHLPDQVSPKFIPPDGLLSECGLPIEQWSDYDWIHVACHGVFPDDQPLEAALRLGKDAVRASEFFAVRLKAALIAFSACDLGGQARGYAGSRLQGDEWIGLYLPLFYAGAQALLVSLWSADSEKAAQFMQTLHSALCAENSPAEAFQSAALSQVTKSPALWANWYLVGFPTS